MLPHQGSGAGQAIEDAYILASLLADNNSNKDTLSAALSVYDQIRRPRGTDVQRFSRNARQVYDFLTPTFTDTDLAHLYSLSGVHLREQGETDDRAVRKLWETGAILAAEWEWAWTTDADGDRKYALGILAGKVRDVLRSSLREDSIRKLST